MKSRFRSPSSKETVPFTGRWAVVRLTVILLIFGAVSSSADQQDGLSTAIPIPRASGEIVIDGVIDEQAWQGAARLEIGFEVQPGENVPAPVTTEVRLTWDEERVLVAFRCFDPDPSAIRARYSDRDQLWNDDWIGIVLDTFNDQRRAYEFVVNPLGVQMDALNDDVNGRYDLSWNAIWYSMGRPTATGYEVEMAIPFSQIRFQKASGPQVWGLDLMRSYPRNVRHHLGLFARDRGNNSYLSQTIKIVGFDDAEAGRNMEIVPTLTGWYEEERPDFPEGDLSEKENSVEAGVTAAWGVTPNTTLTAAVNPDFSQIEADAVQLGINETFALFFSETRPFFQVGADHFNTRLSLLHTRSIADPAAALKVTGKTGRHTYGVFVARDEVTNVLIPGAEESSASSFDQANTSSVGRYRFDFGGNSTLGVMITDREGEDGYSNRVFSGDLRYRLGKNDTLGANVAWTGTRYSSSMVAEFDLEDDDVSGRALDFSYDHSERDWGAWVWYRDISEGYRADMGFQPRVDFQKGGLGGERYWWGEAGDCFNRFEIGMASDYKQRQDGTFYERETEGWVSYEGPFQSRAHFRAAVGTRVHGEQSFSIDGVYFEGSIQPSGVVQLGMSGRYGDWIDFTHVQPATRTVLSPQATIRAGRHLLLDLGHSFQSLDVSEGRLFSAGVSELRGVWQFNVRTFVRLILQHTDIDRDPGLYEDAVERESRELFAQLLFSYKVNPRTVVFVGYSDGALGNEDHDLKTANRTLFAKVGYSFLF